MADKYLLVTIKRNPREGASNVMLYPPIWDPYEVDRYKVGPLVRDGGLGRGLDEEECLLCIDGGVADKYVAEGSPDCRILTEAEADAWLAANPMLASMPSEQITDFERIVAVMVKKFVLGAAPSQDDLDALDPNNPARGINKKKTTAAEIFVR